LKPPTSQDFPPYLLILSKKNTKIEQSSFQNHQDFPPYLLIFSKQITKIEQSSFQNHPDVPQKTPHIFHKKKHVPIRIPHGVPRLVIHVKLMDENGKPRPIRGSPFRPTLTKRQGGSHGIAESMVGDGGDNWKMEVFHGLLMIWV